jgi:hypothetical protein
MTLGTILLIVVVLLLIGAFPTWPHSRGWGYGPSGGLGLVLLILLVLLLLGKIQRAALILASQLLPPRLTVSERK